MKMQIKSTIVLLLGIGFIAPAIADDIFVPLLSSKADGAFDIGIERTGTATTLVRITNFSKSIDTSDKTKESILDRLVSKEKTTTTATNPNKDATAPKSSGLLTGIASAFGGNYSALGTWGMGFLDHMAEPKFKTTVSNTTLKKELNQTKATETIKASLEKKQEFLAEVAKSYSQDINKGYIRFSVILTNEGKKGVTIDNPSYSAYFTGNGADWYVGKGQATDLKGKYIASGKSIKTSITIRDLDFEKLFSKYADASAVRIEVQELNIREPGKDNYISVDEYTDKLKEKNVSVDYFDGISRVVKFAPVEINGETVESFLKRLLSDKDWVSNPTAADFQEYIQRIGSKSADSRKFSDLKSIDEKYKWRRWFITILDKDGEVVETAKLTSFIKPGYSVRIGYFGAEDVLPETAYRPIVCEQKFVGLKHNTKFMLPCETRLGDVLSFEDIKIERYTQNFATFTATKANGQPGYPNQYVDLAIPQNAALSVSGAKIPNSSSLQNYYKLFPVSVEKRSVDAKDILLLPPTSKIASYNSILWKRIAERAVVESLWQTLRSTKLILNGNAAHESLAPNGGRVILPSASELNLLIEGTDFNWMAENLWGALEHKIEKPEETGSSTQWAFFKKVPCLPRADVFTNSTFSNQISGRLLREFVEVHPEVWVRPEQNVIAVVEPA